MKQRSNAVWRGIRLLCALLLLVAAGCDSDPAGKIFRFDLDGPVDNLDPQFADNVTARLILPNLYEGLVIQEPGGEVQPGVAERYTISDNRLVYTFYLREDAAWSNGEPVTAADFYFAFQRMFRDGSPNAWRFSSILGAREMLAGGASALPGVEVRGERQLVITLAEADPLFLEALCDPAAAPCNEQAFADARGRYGLEEKLVCANGPFYVDSWTDARLLLRANTHYRSERETVAGGVNLYIGRNGASQFHDGKTDIALLTHEQQEGLSDRQAVVHPIQKTVWCIVFNQNHALWGNPLLRQGLAHGIDRESIGDTIPTSFQLTSLLAPDAMRVMGKPYRELAGDVPTLEFDTQQAERLLEMGLDALGLSQLPSTATITVPEEMRLTLGINALQQGWQKHVSAYLNFETATAEQIQRRLRSGDYQILLMPMTPGDSNISTLLNAFRSDSAQNYFGYRNPIYDDLLRSAAEQQSAAQAAVKYAQAETLLLSDAVMIPLYFETSYLAIQQGVQDIWFTPFGDSVSFKYAQKDG